MKYIPESVWQFIVLVLIACGGIIILWITILKLHTWNCVRHYNALSIPIKDKEKKIKKDETLNSLLKMFFYRQITYEFSAFAILIICVFFLIACIGLFLYANRFVLIEDPKNALDANQKLISVISIRAGIALVIFFICRVLLKLYRFCLDFQIFIPACLTVFTFRKKRI